ncbi:MULTISPECIES: VWA domain-containing protein [unclassified Massilia]|uniref:VWA domain-containing protein n=1 Tax=unclassified Massilia TaxID=2609279 RepID=UPI001785977A|nr:MULTISPECIES: VWA domain-containing protein [unclassified Massilia]MBD8530928.1 VWA domain-containing protein [Massilia sp. CFBP 13647]MBD8674659.1 VWA domain-containing protein [Massilia sp. CFBP 13721]
MHPQLHRQRGAVAIMVALAMLVLLAVVGLVIDAGLAYLVKARLNAAVDSAALAAARAVPAGNNQTEQRASAQTAAGDFFAANIPTTYLLSRPKLLSTNIEFNGGTVTIDVRAEAPMPVSIMQVLGFTALNPVAYAQTIRRDLDMAFVVDTSGSLNGNRTAVKASAKTFLNKFNVTQDRVALMHFAYGTEVDNPIYISDRGFNRTSMLSKIDTYQFVGGTGSVEGMWNARNQLNRIPLLNRSAMRVIVFFSDGAPTGISSYFNMTTDCREPGVINSSDGDLSGLYELDDTDGVRVSTKCTLTRNNSGVLTNLTKLPDWYNAHNTYETRDDVSKREFPIVTTSSTPGFYRSVTSDLSTKAIAYRNIDRTARNLAEAVAAKARDEGIFVFTLGMGAALKSGSGYDNERGEDVLKCMANVADGPSRCYNPNKPVGMYCYAATEADLTPCFSRLASAILRISK